jgi:hypothetical protein
MVLTFGSFNTAELIPTSRISQKVNNVRLQCVFPAYYNVYEWLLTGFGLVTRFIDRLQTEITSNYGANANLHPLQITREHAKVFSIFFH